MAPGKAMMSGTLSFGFVNIPVKLYKAARDHGVSFHMFHSTDHARITMPKVCSACEQSLTPDEIVKGYEVTKDEYVFFENNELDALGPETTKALEILQFTDESNVNPLYYGAAYYLEPEVVGQKAYALLRAALLKTKKVAVGRFVMRGKEHLMVVRPEGPTLTLSLLHWADEVDPPEIIEAPALQVDEKELGLATRIVNTLTAPLDMESFHDEHRDRVMNLIEAKIAGQEFKAPVQRTVPQLSDLMAALEQSVEAAEKTKARR